MENVHTIFQNIMKNADRQWGGFGKAPKFPQSFTIQFLLRYHYHTGNEEAFTQALLSLDKMIEGGIYDQLGGGFARYSTDTEWLAPHFEKMLYDNALLLSVMSEAFQLTGKRHYRDVIKETMEFVQREMLHPSGGFYSALDADSEGVEGKFYTWSKNEIEQLLGEDAAIFCDYYDVTAGGNWEHTNILWVRKSSVNFAAEKEISEDELLKTLHHCKEKLMLARSKRIRPLLDDKIILGWNALMNIACSKAYAATGTENYLQLAIENMNFLLKHFTVNSTEEFLHTWKNNQARYPAFLDDYAFLIEALLHLQEVTGDTTWIDKAKAVTEYVIRNFGEKETGFFYYTAAGQRDVIVRKKEVYDGAVPSGNSVMAKNLWQLSILFDEPEWRQRSADMTASLGNAIVRYPTSFGNWAGLLMEFVNGINEIAIIGDKAGQLRSQVLQEYIPQRVIMSSSSATQGYPLLAGKLVSDKTSIYLCRSYTCQRPVFSVNELMLLIDKSKNQQ